MRRSTTKRGRGEVFDDGMMYLSMGVLCLSMRKARLCHIQPIVSRAPSNLHVLFANAMACFASFAVTISAR